MSLKEHLDQVVLDAAVLFSHPPNEQHHNSTGRCRYNQRHQPTAKREKHSDVIADERTGNAHQRARDDAAGRSGELPGEPRRPGKSVEKNTGDNADYENQ